ncbi:MAG: histidine phosphatase family protein [Novosphingobium sp. SCN 66-18]|nr:MAG: histidine phosphatase family protein [Novosphingobium sp. SCN 66-18]
MKAVALHLLRHGPPLRPGLLLGRTDDAARDPGCARLLAPAMALDVAGIVTSDLRRARASAEALALARGLPLAVDPRWRELDFGDWDGRAPEDLAQADLARFWDDPDAWPPPGGERWSALCHRVGQAICALDRATLVVTHAGAMRAAVSVLTGLDHRAVWAFDVPYGALLSFRVWPGEKPAGQITGLQAGGGA